MTASILAPHPGTRCKPKPPPLHRRFLARLRAIRRRRAVEEARDDAYAADLHEFNADRYIPAPPPPPPVVAAGQPPAAVLADRDVPGMEHLASGQYGDDTHAFSRYVDGGQE